MSLDYAEAVVVASGPPDRVGAWARALGAASIPFEVAEPCGAADPARPGHAELWVRREDADEARDAIRGVPGRDAPLW